MDVRERMQVFQGSPAYEAGLERGDVIAQVEGHDASRLTYRQAHDVIKAAANALLLRIWRRARHSSFRTARTLRTKSFLQNIMLNYWNRQQLEGGGIALSQLKCFEFWPYI